MTKVEKLVETFLTNPTSLRYAQIVKVLEHFGFELIQAKGSHVKFKHQQLTSDLVIPLHHNDCKNFYKLQAKKQIEKL